MQAAKFDIEGSETSAIRGFRRTLASNPPCVIFCEFNPKDTEQGQSLDLFSILRRHGYSAHVRVVDEDAGSPFHADPSRFLLLPPDADAVNRASIGDLRRIASLEEASSLAEQVANYEFWLTERPRHLTLQAQRNVQSCAPVVRRVAAATVVDEWGYQTSTMMMMDAGAGTLGLPLRWTGSDLPTIESVASVVAGVLGISRGAEHLVQRLACTVHRGLCHVRTTTNSTWLSGSRL